MPSNPLTDPNWAESTTDQVVQFVDQVKDRTTRPAVMAARGLVFGFLAAFLGVFALIVFLITVTRGLQVGILEHFMEQPRAVYTSYLIVGGILSLVGLLLFRKRNQGT